MQIFVARDRVPGVFAIVLAIQKRRTGKAGDIFCRKDRLPRYRLSHDSLELPAKRALSIVT